MTWTATTDREIAASIVANLRAAAYILKGPYLESTNLDGAEGIRGDIRAMMDELAEMEDRIAFLVGEGSE